MTSQEFRKAMSQLLMDTKKSRQQLIASAVQLGMDYQEQKIKAGIDIVFKSLHEKNGSH